MTKVKVYDNSKSVPFMFAVSKITIDGFKTSGTVERKCNSKKYPHKTTMSTTVATAVLFRDYNY